MGKIRRSRTKLHQTAPKAKTSNDTNECPPVKSTLEEVSSATKEEATELGGLKLTEVDLHLGVEKDAKTKKGKRKARREKFLSKLSASYQLKQKEKEAKKRAKTAVVGDMQPLFDALPDFKSLFEASIKTTKTKSGHTHTVTKEKGRTPKSGRSRMKANLADINLFQQVSEDSSFKSDPASAILNHLKYLNEKEGNELV